MERAQVHFPDKKGFALVVTLMLMVLLSILAVGLLSLSAVSIRSTRGGSDLQTARANARMALVLAIGQLQNTAGDDRRITVAADQLPSPDGNSSVAVPGRKFWTGVYRSWEAETTKDASQWQSRPDPAAGFLGWLVSSPGMNTPDAAISQGGLMNPIRLVGSGTVGTDEENWVEAGLVPVKEGAVVRGNMAWWVGDQSLKSTLAIKEPVAPTLTGDARLRMQSAPTGNFRTLKAGTETPFGVSDFADARVTALTGFPQLDHFVPQSERAVSKELFHDVAVYTSGLMTNVRSGGFRKDLSMYLENSSTTQQRDVLAADILYQVPSQNGVSTEPGINMEELAAYYKLHTQLVAGSGNFTTDGAAVPSSAQSLRFGSTPNACRDDYFHFFKQPVPIAYDSFFSLEARQVGGTPQNEPKRYDIRIVVDPVVIMWNPLDVPVTIPAASVPSIKFWTSPFTVNVVVKNGAGGSTTYRCHLHGTLSSGDHNYMSLDLTTSGTPLVFRPGEVMMVSQKSKTDGRSHQISGGPGFNFQSGLSLPLMYGDSMSALQQVTLTEGDTMEVTLERNGYVNPRSGGPNRFPGLGGHTRWYSLMHNEMYLGRDRVAGGGPSLPIGGVYVDWDLSKVRLKRNDSLRTSSTSGNKPDSQRLVANVPKFADLMTQFTNPVSIRVNDIAVVKKPLGVLSFRAKTESGISSFNRGTSWLSRFNPKVFLHDFYDFSEKERDMSAFEVYVLRLTDLRDYGLLEQNQGRAFFGAAWSLGDGGQTALTTHSVPREPLVSLAAFQHSMANGFLFQAPKETPGDGYGTLNTRDPLNPQISHAVGNSVAPAVIAADKTFAIMSDGSGRPLADHSYLANRSLWDDWFLSSIAPMTATTSFSGLSQKALADAFFNGTRKLPNSRYTADLGGLTPTGAVNKIFDANAPRVDAKDIVASLLRVEGMFNVNSTSVAAWTSVLSGLREGTIASRDAKGTVSMGTSGIGKTPVTGQLTPENQTAGKNVFQDPAPWVGRRELDDTQIEELAKAIVREIRLSGPFLSLSDFVNRRPGSDKKLAVAGPVQRALDNSTVSINSAFRSGQGVVSSSAAGRFAFPEAEEGLKSRGIPGIVKQADILTPIAPFITVRSDSFIIRAYGEVLDNSGKVVARAWCEALVERDRDFLDPADDAETPIASLTSQVNKDFGRRFKISQFHWLSADEV